MFERNRIDNVDHTCVPVELTTAEGEQLKGRILVAPGRGVFEALNSAGAFVEFEPYGGERTYIAKSVLRDVKLLNVPRSPRLGAALRDADGFDPHGILGLPSSASFEDVKAAWHRLSKVYHPDRFASVELPAEVRDYLSTMVRRINAAYAALEAPQQTKAKAAYQRSTPVYTSQGR